MPYWLGTGLHYVHGGLLAIQTMGAACRQTSLIRHSDFLRRGCALSGSKLAELRGGPDKAPFQGPTGKAYKAFLHHNQDSKHAHPDIKISKRRKEREKKGRTGVIKGFLLTRVVGFAVSSERRQSLYGAAQPYGTHSVKAGGC